MKKYNYLMLSLLLLALCGTVVNFFYNALLAHVLSADHYGDFIVAYRVLGIVAVVLLLGTDVSSFSYIPIFLKEKERTNLLAYISWTLRLILITSMLFLFCYFCFMAIGYALHHFGIYHFDDQHLAADIIYIAPVFVLAELFITYLFICNQSRTAYFLDQLLPQILIGCILYLIVVLLDMQVSDFMFSIVVVISLLMLSLATILTFMKRGLPKLSHAVVDSIAHPVKKNNHWLSHALRLMAGVFLVKFVSSLDIFLVEMYSPIELSVGYYAEIMAVCFFVMASSYTSYKPLLPLISVGFASGDLDELKKKLRVSNKVNALYSLLSSLVIFYFLPEITVFFFGASYEQPCVFAGRILLVAYVVSSLLWPATILLRHTHNERKEIQCRFVEMALLVGVGIPLTRWYGIAGMAATQLLVQGVSGSIKLFFVRRILKIKPLSLI